MASPTTAAGTATKPASELDRPRRRLEDAWRRFRRNRTAMAGLGVIAVMAVLAVFARPLEVSTSAVTITLQPFSLAPYDPSAMFVGPANAPPSRAHPFG
ncbi:ABC transporter permease, partial [Natrinema soli]